jgi:hypothetical protein
MYPQADVEIVSELPTDAEFWTPQPDDIDEENFGYFRDVWPIIGVPEDEAREMLERDRLVSNFASNLATSDAEFDAIAKVIETGEGIYASELSNHIVGSLSPYVAEDEDDDVMLDGLEVGVAGLVYALSAAGVYPAASCRSHPTKSTWSPVPVVLVAVDQCRAHALAPLVKDTDCGFDLDPSRPELLVIYSKSIREMLDLAQRVIDSLSEFDKCG